MALQPIPFEDFSGGVADRYIGTDTTRGAVVDNFLIDETRKPYVRNGSFIYSQQIPTYVGGIKPTGLYVTSSPLNHPLIISGANAYTLNESGGFTKITGYASNQFLINKTDSTFESSAIWRRQLVSVAGTANVQPQMIYCYSTTNPASYKIVTLGLPNVPIPTTSASGSAWSGTYAFLYRYTIVDSNGTLFEYFSNPANSQLSVTNATGDPGTNNINLVFSATLPNIAYTNYDLTNVVTGSSLSTGGPVGAAGLNTVTTTMASSVKVGMQMIGTGGQWDGSTPYVVVAISGNTLTLSRNLVGNLFGNASFTFCFASFIVSRTVNGGNTFFIAGSVPVPASGTFSDVISDAVLVTNETIYTSGGALGYDAPPTGAIAVTEVNDYFWYATSTTLYQSIQGNPGACPSSFQDQPAQKIIGLSDVVGFPILFCDRTVYRVEGTFDSFGNGGFIRRPIPGSPGCMSNRSIVKIPEGLVWFGNGGVWYTNGYQAQKISRHLDKSYKYWANQNSVGEYDPSTNTVWWTISSFADGSTDANDSILVLHLNYGLKPESVFTTLSSRGNLYPTTLAFANSIDVNTAGSPYSTFYNKMLFTDARGYLCYFDPLALTDPLIDTTLSPSSMAKKTIMYNFTTAGLDQGTVGFRKYTPEVSVELESDTNLALQIQHRRDDGGSWSGTGGSPASGLAGSPGGGTSGTAAVPEIRQDGNIVWGITDCAWANDSIEHPWDSFSTIQAKRSINSGILRSGRRQLRFTNSYTNIANSDTLGTATVSATAKTVTLDNVSNLWITDPEGYYITFVADNYNQTFLIKSRVSDTVLSLYDPLSLLTSGSTKWVIKGYRKFERVRILSFTLHAEIDGPTQSPSTSSTGANA